MLAISKNRHVRPALEGHAFRAMLLVALGLAAGGCRDPGVEALVKGDRFLRQGAHEQALEECQKAVRSLPHNAEAWNRLGLAYHGLRQPQQALKAYEKARQLDHKLAAVQFNLGCLLVELGKHDLAEQELTSFTMQQPGALPGWLWLGRAQFRAGHHEAAERSFKTLLEVDPYHPEARNDLGVIQVHRRRYADAMQQFALVMTRHPTYSPALYNAAVVNYDHLKNRSLARLRLAEYLDQSPASAHSPEILAWFKSLNPETQLASVRSNTPPTKPKSLASRTQNATSPPSILQPYHPEPKPTPKTNLTTTVAPPPRATLTPPPPSVEPTNAPRTSVIAKPHVATNLASTSTSRQAKPEPAPAPRVSNTTVTTPRTSPPTEKGVSTAPHRTPATRPSPAQPTPPKPAPTTPLQTVPVEPDLPVTAPVEIDSSTSQVPKVVLGNTTSRDATPRDTQSSTTRIARSKPAESSPLPEMKSGARYKYRQPKAQPPGDRSQAEVFLRDGFQLHRSGRQSYAIQRYQEAVQADPAYFEAYYNMAVAAFEIADWQQSLAAYESALALKPESVDAHFNFCIALQKANYPADAVNELNRLLKRNPDLAKAHLALANLYANTYRNPKRARPHYQRVIEISPQHPEGDRIRSWLNTTR